MIFTRASTNIKVATHVPVYLFKLPVHANRSVYMTKLYRYLDLSAT